MAQPAPSYLHLPPNCDLPRLAAEPSRIVLVAEGPVDHQWRNAVAEWLVAAGCLYFVAWGVDCELWHGCVDDAVLARFAYGEIPDDAFVMTTWHTAEPLAEAFWYAGNCAFHPDVELSRTMMVHLASQPAEAAMLGAYAAAQQ